MSSSRAAAQPPVAAQRGPDGGRSRNTTIYARGTPRAARMAPMVAVKDGSWWKASTGRRR